MNSHTSPPIPVTAIRGGNRTELVFGGVDMAGPSFEGRVFLNNPQADADTAPTPESGYAGSFYVYGYGEPESPEIAAARARGEKGPFAPIEQQVQADEAVVRAALENADELTVTVVPIPADPGGKVPERPFEKVDVVLDRGATER
jgi:hypothetical protein